MSVFEPYPCGHLFSKSLVRHSNYLKYAITAHSSNISECVDRWACVFIVKKIADVILTAILYVHCTVHVLSVCGNGLTDSHDEFLLNL